MADLLERVLEHEGFREKPYQDSLGVWTIGHGLTFITEEQSKLIVAEQLIVITRRLLKQHRWIKGVPLEITTEMCFQLGWTGCHNFKKMWKAVRAQDYEKAADEMLDSKWATQTPARAKELSEMMRHVQKETH